MKISLVIITLNEEDRLEETLKSCREIADEIVVIDSFSTDRTIDIARKYTTHIFKNPFVDYSTQKNLAIDKAKYDWILNLDADERISGTLKDEIIKLKKAETIPFDGFFMNRKTYYLGRWVKHSGWYPDQKLRLFKKDKSRWQGRVHERLIVNGKVGRINGDIIHYTYRDMDDHLNRINRYSRMQAQDIARRGKKLLLLRALILPPITFLRFYIWKMGVLDGFAGLVIALVSSWGTAQKYLKAIEIKKGEI
jgi:glycosyltransferase involved in cell wall biosynthesis